LCAYLKYAESTFVYTRLELSPQGEPTSKMRATLVDWLIEVSEEFDLVPETTFLSVYLMDRYLQNDIMSRKMLQLLGVTSLYIAAKFEEIYVPRIDEFCDITDNTYTVEEVIAMERQILQAVKFRICQPTAWTFVAQYLQVPKPGDADFLTSYLCELTLVDCTFNSFRPSRIAACSRMLGILLTGGSWSSQLREHTGYGKSCLRSCALKLKSLAISEAVAHLAVHEKYSSLRFGGVAKRLLLGEWIWPI